MINQPLAVCGGVVPYAYSKVSNTRKTQLDPSTDNGTGRSVSVGYEFCVQVSWLVHSLDSIRGRLGLSCARNFTVSALQGCIPAQT